MDWQSILPHWGKRYWGLIADEPINTIWNSRQEMHEAGAFLSRQGAIDSFQGSVSAIMLCGKYANDIISSEDIHFLGQASETPHLTKANLALAQCIIQPDFPGIRVYVTSKHEHDLAPVAGIKLLGILFPVGFNLECHTIGKIKTKKDGTSVPCNYMWQFHLRSQPLVKEFWGTVEKNIADAKQGQYQSTVPSI